MVIYSVTITVKKEVEKVWFDWMQNTHVPNVIKTGYFSNSKMFKILIPSAVPDEITYVIQYETDSFEKYKEYSEKEASRLQREHASKFMGKFTAARAIMEVI